MTFGTGNNETSTLLLSFSRKIFLVKDMTTLFWRMIVANLTFGPMDLSKLWFGKCGVVLYEFDF